MKKVFSFLAVLAVVLMFSSSAWAVFSSSTTVALATIPAGETEFSVQLYDWENTYSAITSTNTIHWDTLNTLVLSSGTAQFKCANVYALLKSTMTEKNTKILLYTDNFHNTKHVAVSSDSTNKGRGLVDTTGKKYAQLSYMCKKLSAAKASQTTLPADSWGDPFDGWYPSWGVRVIYDKSDGEYSETNENAIIASTMGTKSGEERGVWFFGDGNPIVNSYTTEDVVMFFGAQFLNVLGGESYGTESITFEKLVE